MHAGIGPPGTTLHNTPLLTVFILAADTCVHSLGGGQEWRTQKEKRNEDLKVTIVFIFSLL